MDYLLRGVLLLRAPSLFGKWMVYSLIRSRDLPSKSADRVYLSSSILTTTPRNYVLPLYFHILRVMDCTV